MKIRLFNNQEFDAQVKEEKDILTLTMNFNKMIDWTNIGEALTNSNLCKVVITYEDGSYSEYKNLKFLGADMSRKANLYRVIVTLTTKTEFEMMVDSLSTVVESQRNDIDKSNTDVTKTQLAIVEIYELLLPLLGL